MGLITALGFAESVAEAEDKDKALRSALYAHLTGNFYPPLPAAYVPLLAQAIEHCAEGDYSALVALPDDLDPKPRKAVYGDGDDLYVEAGTLVDICRAEPFINAYLYADDDDETEVS